MGPSGPTAVYSSHCTDWDFLPNPRNLWVGLGHLALLRVVGSCVYTIRGRMHWATSPSRALAAAECRPAAPGAK